jgi:hypothetical protein
MMGYDSDYRGSISDKTKAFFFHSTVASLSLGPNQPIQRIRGLFPPGLKYPGREADRSPPYSSEAKKRGATTPLPHTSS